MADVKKSEVEEKCVPVSALSPAKRKLDSTELDVSKKLKPEMPVEEVNVVADGDVEAKAVKSDAEIEVDDDDEADDDEFDGEEDEEEKPNGGSEIDRKGKGIMREEDEEDEDDDSSDEDDDFSGEEIDSDLEHDPLAEVDLDNILPSRTRRRGAAPTGGICLSKNEARSQSSTAGKGDIDA